MARQSGYASPVFLIPDTATSRRIATIGAVFIAAVMVRLVLGFAKPDLTDAQGAIAGMTTAVLVAPTIHTWLGGSGSLVPEERKASYAVLCACAALSFLVFVGLGIG